MCLVYLSLSGMLMLLLGFFAFLHCWLNAFAEMLRFADRMFYKVRNLSTARLALNYICVVVWKNPYDVGVAEFWQDLKSIKNRASAKNPFFPCP